MAKSIKPKKYSPVSKESKVEEPFLEYRSVKRLPAVADFSFKKFEKIAALVPFTQKEWSNILHLSERTLQRYAKDNSNFEGIYADRILHIEQLIQMGLETFANADALYRWLHRNKKVMGNTLGFEALYSTLGIQNIIDELGRIQHGIYI